jgi:hypothetical protein
MSVVPFFPVVVTQYHFGTMMPFLEGATIPLLYFPAVTFLLLLLTSVILRIAGIAVAEFRGRGVLV